MWSQGLDLVGKRNNWKIYVLGKNNCGPAALTYYQYQLKRDLVECDAWQNWRMDQIRQLKPAAVVLIGWYGNNTGPGRPFSPQVWRDGLIKTVEQLPPGTKPVLINNQPHITINPGECLARNSDAVNKCAEKASDVVPTEANAAIQQAAEMTSGAYVDVTPWFCAETCPLVIADVVPYSGKYHINNDYGRYLSGVLADVLRPAMA
jgi:hypothetical protein